jgi:hypothetical protein
MRKIAKKKKKECHILFQGLREVAMGGIEYRSFMCELDKMGKERELKGPIDINSSGMLFTMSVCFTVALISVLYFPLQVYPNLRIFILRDFVCIRFSFLHSSPVYTTHACIYTVCSMEAAKL